MKLVKCKIENFRSYENAEIDFTNLNVIIGKNDVGKSTILEALKLFFDEKIKASSDDVNVYSGGDSFSITCCFEVNPKEKFSLDSSISEETSTTLEDEFLLDENGLLQIKKKWKGGKADKTFIIANYPSSDAWKSPLITLKINDLKSLIPTEQKELVNKGIKKEIRGFLFKNSEYEIKRQEIDISAKDSDISSIYIKLKDKLPSFFLFKADRKNTDQDNEVAQVTKAITQGVTQEIEQEFKRIQEQILKEVKNFTNSTLNRLKELNSEVVQDISADIDAKSMDSLFSFDFKSDDQIPFNNRGSGVKRLFLLSFFLEDSERKASNGNMIYAIEEPETSQHPNFQKMIIEALKVLSQKEGRQIFITTHTPEIVKMVDRENLIFIQRENNQRLILQGEKIESREIIETLGILPYISYKGVMFVEGDTDIKFFKNLNKHFPCLREIFDIEQITLIPLHGGGNVKKWIMEDYLKESNIKRLHFIDRDESNDEIKGADNTDNCHRVMKTKKREIENYFPINVLEDYFSKDLQGQGFPEEFKKEWDNQDIARYLAQKAPNYQTANNKRQKQIENEFKMRFDSKELWKQLNESNMQGFDEIKEWFCTMRDFFNN